MQLGNKISSYFLLAITLVIIIGIIVSIILGNRQNEQFVLDQAYYNEALQSVMEGKYEEAYKYISNIEDNYLTSDKVNYIIALSAANSDNLDKGVLHMQRALNINPYYVEDAIFMLQYAQMLIMANKTEEAKVVLANCELLPAPESYPAYHETVAELQKLLTNDM